MFLNHEDFPFLIALEDNWKTIREEYYRLEESQFLDWPERRYYDEGWKVFGLYARGIKLEINCERCPETTKIVEDVPALDTAGFSLLKPKTHITPHKGKADGLLRCHLGLIIPEQCGIRVGEEHGTWEEGRALVFDDSLKHEAWNHSQSDRVVLLLDFSAPNQCVNPPKEPKPLVERLVSRIGRKLARLSRLR